VKPHTVAIVQARMGSQRFPGKMLARLGPYPLLQWVLQRASLANGIDEVILATSVHERDDLLVELAAGLGIPVCRGSEEDVLGRFTGAADSARADWVVRICADNPFVDPGELDRLVAFFAEHPCDYACNHLDRLGSGYTDGFGAEILSAALLRRLAEKAGERRYREHVTLYLWEHSERYDLRAVPAPEELRFPQLRFDVDRPGDLVNLACLVARGVSIDTPAARIVQAALADKDCADRRDRNKVPR
jgi:spore coat polysaccharide biosynthesis protein SpsF